MNIFVLQYSNLTLKRYMQETWRKHVQ